MKIKKIEFYNHKILGDFAIDFSVDNVIKNISLLVSENGCGKTTLLEEIYKILTESFAAWENGPNKKITFEFTEDEKNKFSLSTHILTIEYDKSKSENNMWGRFFVFDENGNDISASARSLLYNNPLTSAFKCAFSTVEINFEKRSIESIKATSIDSDEFVKNKSTNNIATEISQLLVDIKNQDNAEKANLFDSGAISTEQPYAGKFDRFKAAYSKMFNGKELKDVITENNNYKIIFKDLKKNVEFDISDLSSGEKQIVYRAGYLLKNLRGITSGVVLIDEPELSLHPIWQEKYLQFIREVFLLENKNDIQFVIATHSFLLLKDALKDGIVINIFRKDSLGQISVINARDKGFGLLKWSPSWGEICHFAYGLPTIEFHNDLYSAIEDKLKNDPSDRIAQAVFEKYIKDNAPNTPIIKWKTSSGHQKEETIMTFVRNNIHHPDNIERPKAEPDQLTKSIHYMLKLITS